MSNAEDKGRVFLWLALAILLALIGLARLTGTMVDEDNIWLAYAAVPPPPEIKALEQAFHAHVAGAQDCFASAFRLGLRERYASNYGGYLAVQSLIHWLWASIEGPGLQSLLGALATAKALLYAIAVGALLWASARARDRELGAAIALALLAIAAFDLLAHSGWVPTFWIADLAQPLKAVAKLGYSVVIPSEAHSLFGLTPRNAALALFALAMVLRWRGLPLAAALAILLVGVMHQTYGGLALFLFAASAAISNPSALRGRGVQALLTLAAILYVLRDRYLPLQLGLQLVALAAVVLLAAAAFAAIRSGRYGRLRTRLLGRLESREILVDAAVMLAICILVTLVALAASRHADPLTAFYFWADLAMRIWSFARFPLFVAAACLLLGLIRNRRGALEPALAVSAILLALAAVLQIELRAFDRWQADARQILAADQASPVLRLPSGEAALYLRLGLASLGQQPPAALRGHLLERRLVCSTSANPGSTG